MAIAGMSVNPILGIAIYAVGYMACDYIAEKIC